MKKGYCLVLSGGGAKGVYHLGVWKALNELGVEVDAFIGTSIGAVVAGLLAQPGIGPLEGLGESIGVDSIVALPESFVEEGKISIGKESLSEAQDLFLSIIQNRGLDTSPLRKLLESLIDEEAIRDSGKDLGIVTINLSDFRPREMFIEEMEKGAVIDYLMASAALPGFRHPVIKGKKYLDGGIFDNIPYAMARQRGYRRIIVSDISGLGLNRRPEIEGGITIYIKNSINMGGILDFDRGFMKDFERLGYLDTLRVFGRLEGYSYFIEPDGNSGIETAALPNGEDDAGPAPAFPKAMVHDRNMRLKYLECAASIVEVPRIERYGYEQLAATVSERRSGEENKIADILDSGSDKKGAIAAMIRESITSGNFKGSPYYYHRLIEEFMPKPAGKVLAKALASLFPELPAGLDYMKKDL